MTYSKEIMEETKKLHYDSIIIDGCPFFCEGHNDALKASGITV